MSQTVLIYADKRQRKQLAKMKIQVVAEYDDYVLADVTAAQLAGLRAAKYEVDVPPAAAAPGPMRTRMLAAPAWGPPPDSFGPGTHYYLVEFIGPVKAEWLEQIRREGGAPQEPLPPYGYVVGLDQGAYEWLTSGLPAVRSVQHYTPAMRLSPDVSRSIVADPLLSRGRVRSESAPTGDAEASSLPNAERVISTYTVRFFEADDLEQALPALRELGGQPGAYDVGATILTVSFTPGDPDLANKAERLAHIHGVRAVETYKLRQLYNSMAPQLMGAQEVISPAGLGLTGRGEIVGVADSGLDSGNPANMHPDFAGHIAAILSWPVASDWGSLVTNVGGDDGASDARSGHGTHVAGSVVGNGAAAPQLGIRGLAPEARLVFQAIEQTLKWTSAYRAEYYKQNRRMPPDYGLAGLPVRLGAIFEQAYAAGARIHNNSWGGGDFGAYDEYSEEVDRFAWEHKDFLIIFAAGNDGVDANRDGQVDEGSVTPPGTAKNCLTVGAAESLRSQGGYQLPYGRLWPALYPTEPLRSRDKPSDNADHLAAFSSRGPTQDGRIKPDLVAPGTNILSTRSQVLADRTFNAWGPFTSPAGKYMFDGGTSMAAPLTTGAAALVRQFLRTVKRRPNPTAALIKATLLHAARFRPLAADATGKLADFAQGWGHLDLGSVLAPRAPMKTGWYENAKGLQSGQSLRFSVVVRDTSVPFAITLAWTDYPGSAGHYPNLVNDLDLVVTSPTGETTYGSTTGTAANAPDRLNNVERMVIAQPVVGRYQLRVRGFNIPHGPQDFALVWSGGV